MFSLLTRIRTLALQIDLSVKLFEAIVKPVLLYGAEVWGCEDSAILERLQLKFYKYLLGLNKSTCSSMVYGELGVFPL